MQSCELILNQSKSLPDFLKRLLESRTRNNGAYSLRSLALRMKVSPSMLSRVVSGQRQFSRPQVEKLAAALKLGPDEMVRLFLLADVGATSIDCQNGLRESLALDAGIQARKVTETERFEVLEKWYHVAILEMVSLTEQPPTFESFSERLGIPENEIRKAFTRLEVGGYLQKDPQSGRWTKSNAHLHFQADRSPLALRAFYRQMLDQASRKLRPESVDQRYFASETIAFDYRDLPKARRAIDRCLKELVLISNQSKDPATVFHAGVQFFELLTPVSKKAGPPLRKGRP